MYADILNSSVWNCIIFLFQHIVKMLLLLLFVLDIERMGFVLHVLMSWEPIVRRHAMNVMVSFIKGAKQYPFIYM